MLGEFQFEIVNDSVLGLDELTLSLYFLDHTHLVRLGDLFDSLDLALEGHDLGEECVSKKLKAILVFCIALSSAKLVQELTAALNSLIRKT